MVRINHPELSTLDPYYEEKLITKAVDMYMETERYHRTKNSKQPPKPLNVHSESQLAESEDTFLPTPFSSVRSPNILTEEEFPCPISDSDSEPDNDIHVLESDSEGEQPVHSVSDSDLESESIHLSGSASGDPGVSSSTNVTMEIGD